MKLANKTMNIFFIAGLYLTVFLLDIVPGVPPMLLTVLKKGVIFSLVAVSMNLLNGFTGLFSLGQAGFMLMGAYSYAVINISSSLKPVVYQYYSPFFNFSLTEVLGNALGGFGVVLGVTVSMIIAGLVAAFMAFLIGLPVLKLKSDYLAIATLGFAEIVRALIQLEALAPVTNGSQLLRGFPYFRGIFIPFIIVGICIAVIVLLINSTYGRAFKAIRDDEIAAEAMGINLASHKRLAFVISSFFAGVSGALLAMYQTTVQANTFKSAMTYEILLIVVIGGIGSVSGSCIGSFLFIACSEWWLRFLDNSNNNIFGLNILRSGFRMVVFSFVIMIMVLFFRKGIMGEREISSENIVKSVKSLICRIKKGRCNER
ncbi:MAG: branched-chain amino acid ABC transporter permease [Sphaerochaetaceae bacterium]|nr:branched-chain amino acid ABC transporter permease [Sphaerochaetaceae bacterium]